MDHDQQIRTVLDNYAKLCLYCDRLFSSAQSALSAYMRCGRGCTSCCSLESVLPLEAFVIEGHLRATGVTRPSERAEGVCPFLDEGICAVYPVRPVICRTHGLPIGCGGGAAVRSCELNFVGMDLAGVPQAYVLDTTRVTDNLVRLNFAFCALNGVGDTAGQRVRLAAIGEGCRDQSA